MAGPRGCKRRRRHQYDYVTLRPTIHLPIPRCCGRAASLVEPDLSQSWRAKAPGSSLCARMLYLTWMRRSEAASR